MDDMTPEEFCEFMRLIRDLRFNSIDTKPEEVENKNIRLAWRSVRPAVIKSIANARNYTKRKEKEEAKKQPIQEIEPNQDFDPQFSNPAVMEEPKQHKTKDNRTIEEKRADWKAAYDNGRKDVYNYWKKLFNSEDEGRSYLGLAAKENKPKAQKYDFDTIDDVAQYLDKVRKEKGRDSYFAEMNYIDRQTDFDFKSINDLMVSRYGYR